MADAGRGRGRGLALLDNLKKIQSERKEAQTSSPVPETVAGQSTVSIATATSVCLLKYFYVGAVILKIYHILMIITF